MKFLFITYITATILDVLFMSLCIMAGYINREGIDRKIVLPGVAAFFTLIATSFVPILNVVFFIVAIPEWPDIFLEIWRKR